MGVWLVRGDFIDGEMVWDENDCDSLLDCVLECLMEFLLFLSVEESVDFGLWKLDGMICILVDVFLYDMSFELLKM